MLTALCLRADGVASRVCDLRLEPAKPGHCSHKWSLPERAARRCNRNRGNLHRDSSPAGITCLRTRGGGPDIS
ncbi:hypothetical protein NDU88_001595 [Pleurodeles waltl]|uniref:Uncharacterized protein n=1 Tax=Pleurodeles waltl TaxID=8319 RepID=A0AAV7TI95_PLEWA|nr:hypothetical protein NDU88_001595 [Pleurodeles waltl]